MCLSLSVSPTLGQVFRGLRNLCENINKDTHPPPSKKTLMAKYEKKCLNVLEVFLHLYSDFSLNSKISDYNGISTARYRGHKSKGQQHYFFRQLPHNPTFFKALTQCIWHLIISANDPSQSFLKKHLMTKFFSFVFSE